MSVGAVSALKNGIFTFSEFQPQAIAAFSTREFDASRDIGLFLKSLGIEPVNYATIRQVHGSQVICVSTPSGPEDERIPEADGLITNKKGLALVIRTADCAPVFFLDMENSAVGIAHAGWRGAKSGILRQTLEMMRRQFQTRTSKLRVGIGPTICESCYEVGPEFLDYFPDFVNLKHGQYHCNLTRIIMKQLNDIGISRDSIHVSGFCTACAADQFFSARREGTETGRLISAIILK